VASVQYRYTYVSTTLAIGMQSCSIAYDGKMRIDRCADLQMLQHD